MTGPACPACGHEVAQLDEWRVDLPYARPPLSLNDRGAWQGRARTIEALKARTRVAVTHAEVPALARVHVTLHYRPRDNRIRDADNLVATLKPCIDALHQPALGWSPIVGGDDRRFVSWSPPVIHPAVKGTPPGVWLTIAAVRA